MKEVIKIIAITSVLVLASCSNRTTSQLDEPQGQVSVDMFYSRLHPYGIWFNYPPYGRVWMPDVAYGFTPYATSGHWVYTSWGWTWNSYYSWGWAPFHYGRWLYDSIYGWVWIPDTVWGPAWVVWSTGGGYCGWAPLGPSVSVSMVLSGRSRIPREQWVFVKEDDLYKRRINRYTVERSRNGELLNDALLIRETRGPRQSTYLPGPKNSAAERSITESLKYSEARKSERSKEARSMYKSPQSSKAFRREMPSVNSNLRERNQPKPRLVRPENQWSNSRPIQVNPGMRRTQERDSGRLPEAGAKGEVKAQKKSVAHATLFLE
ncbi:MAG TPA: DUF6600 domain-containing protein [Cyclobacteriaceae bacterium]|nr:DUF6600 domain-containing protein [Cyclobacteriaceae bacterium]